MENNESLQEKQKKHDTESAADLEKVTGLSYIVLIILINTGG